jgi:hypothetical protein
MHGCAGNRIVYLDYAILCLLESSGHGRQGCQHDMNTRPLRLTYHALTKPRSYTTKLHVLGLITTCHCYIPWQNPVATEKTHSSVSIHLTLRAYLLTNVLSPHTHTHHQPNRQQWQTRKTCPAATWAIPLKCQIIHQPPMRLSYNILLLH